MFPTALSKPGGEGACIIATLALLTRHLSRKWIAALTLVYALYPLFPLYATIRTKDTVATGFTLLLAVALYELIASNGSGGRHGWSAGRIGGRGCRGNHNPADGTVGPDAAGTADGTYTTSPAEKRLHPS